MKNIKVVLFTFFILAFQLTIDAQKAIPASGGNANGTGGSISYTAGQVVYTASSGANGIITQGVQQPFEISIITGLEETIDINLGCSFSPNPASDILTLKVENTEYGHLSYKLFDVNGKLLEDKEISDYETSISMAKYSRSIYFLKILVGNSEVKVFKIIKN